MDKNFIIQEIKRVVALLEKEDIRRDDFLANTPLVTRKDIESTFGSWSKAFEAAGFKPLKHSLISDEQLFEEYSKILKIVGHFPLGVKGQKEISDNSKYSSSVFKKRFNGGLKGFALEYVKWENSKRGSSERSIRTSGKAKEVDPDQSKFINKAVYYGNAAEQLVVAELLFRGYNAQRLSVDEGLDVFALKNKTMYLIQVKHSDYKNASKSEGVSLTISSLKKSKGINVFYIIVLSRREPSQRDFLILPYSKVDELIKNRDIEVKPDAKKATFCVTHKTVEDAFIDKSDVSRYLNAWDVLL